MKKKYGGIGLANLNMVTIGLSCKWIIKGMHPWDSNLHHMICYKLARYTLQRGGKWGINLMWSQTNLILCSNEKTM